MTLAQANTNEVKESCVDANCNCNTLWSMVQQFSVERLSIKTGQYRGKLLKSYEARAKRISATYARFYLEEEVGGDPSKMGRFYWMALGAFASKTVGCALSLRRVKLLPWVSSGLGKGNFWLFCDISGWHWYYANFSNSFSSCLGIRDATQYVPAIRKLVDKLPWSSESLPVIRQLKVSNHIRSGFAKVVEFEKQTDFRGRQALQFNHLLDIANHEQGIILQPLIYADKLFARSVAAQRAPVVSWFSPDVELVFNHSCETENAWVKSIPSEDTIIEDLASRMKWIKSAASQFHDLMIKKSGYMEQELRIMAGWVDAPDS